MVAWVCFSLLSLAAAEEVATARRFGDGKLLMAAGLALGGDHAQAEAKLDEAGAPMLAGLEHHLSQVSPPFLPPSPPSLSLSLPVRVWVW
eukprot:scaffold143303_cov17-Tisochrysis_lutea.AAC.1